MRALEVLEGTTTGTPGLEGVVLRYGFFYGPGTAIARGGHYAAEARRRRLPVVGDGAGRASFVNVDDAAAATLLALDRGAPGIFNVTDDEPVPAREWVPAMAAAVGAPRRPARAAVAGAARRRPDGRDAGLGPRRLQREGARRAGLPPALPDLPRGVRGGAGRFGGGGLALRGSSAAGSSATGSASAASAGDG